MSALMWILLILTGAAAVFAVALSRSTGWAGASWKPPHKRHIQDYQPGDEELDLAERQALAELEALNLHRKHPYC